MYPCYRADIDGWEIRKAMGDLAGMDLVPEPTIVAAALRACRRINDYSLTTRSTFKFNVACFILGNRVGWKSSSSAFWMPRSLVFIFQTKLKTKKFLAKCVWEVKVVFEDCFVSLQRKRHLFKNAELGYSPRDLNPGLQDVRRRRIHWASPIVICQWQYDQMARLFFKLWPFTTISIRPVALKLSK